MRGKKTSVEKVIEWTMGKGRKNKAKTRKGTGRPSTLLMRKVGMEEEYWAQKLEEDGGKQKKKKKKNFFMIKNRNRSLKNGYNNQDLMMVESERRRTEGDERRGQLTAEERIRLIRNVLNLALFY